MTPKIARWRGGCRAHSLMPYCMGSAWVRCSLASESTDVESVFLSVARMLRHAASDRDGATRACAICVGSLMRLTSLNNAPA